MSSEETPNSFSILKLLKAEVRQDHNGVNVVMEFIDDNGTIFKTPSMPYPENFDPMRVEHAECHNGDEIRIKNGDGNTLISIHADSINYNSGINTSISPDGSIYIERGEGEDVEAIHHNGSWSSAMTQAFGEANTARQGVDATIQGELNALEPTMNP